jgi:3-oxoadipate enol-lactonase
MAPDKMEEFINLRKGPLAAGKSLREMAAPLAKTLLSIKPLPEHSRRLVASIEALHKDSYIKTIEASTRYDRPVDISTISVPVQLIYGAEDRLTPPEIGRQMQRQIPGALLEVIEGAGHLVNMERGEVFNEVLLGFLRQHQGLAAPPSMKAP